jgi:O-antigen/teichoic acid export membrane protein
MFIRYYWYWLVIQIGLPLIFILLILPDNTVAFIWNGSDRSLILLALIASGMQGIIWSAATQMAESLRLNREVQVIALIVSILHLLVLLGLFTFGKLVVPYVLLALAVEWGIAGIILTFYYKPFSDDISEDETEPDTLKGMLREYYSYCQPLLFYGVLTFLYDFFDKWMLQRWGGSVQQAYFTVAQSFASIALLATTSTLNIFWKEISAAIHRHDQASVERYYKKFLKILFLFAAVISCSLIPWYKEIVQLLVGKAYGGGALAFMIMCLYPIHQTLGQVDGTLLYSSGNTRLKMKSTIWFTISSLIVTYFTLAPKNAAIPGLGLTSEGMALKMVILQMIYVNFINILIANKFKWKFEFSFQIYNLMIFGLISYLLYIFANSRIVSDVPLIIRMLLSITLYFICSGLCIFNLPALAGISRGEMQEYYSKTLFKFRNPINKLRR